jgi:hypothetical protein
MMQAAGTISLHRVRLSHIPAAAAAAAAAGWQHFGQHCGGSIATRVGKGCYQEQQLQQAKQRQQQQQPNWAMCVYRDEELGGCGATQCSSHCWQGCVQVRVEQLSAGSSCLTGSAITAANGIKLYCPHVTPPYS